jgi:lipopolysaccharide transport protein LptA
MKIKKTIISILYIILFLNPHLTFSKEIQKDKASQLTVEADESLEWFEKEKYYLAKGNVILKKDGLILKADFVKAIYIYINGENTLTKITAKKDVFITKGEARASGEFMTYDLKTKTASITGPFQTFSSPSVYIESTKLMKFNDLDNIAEAIGNVKITLPNKTKIFGDKVRADFTSKDKSLKKAMVKGNVIIENSGKEQKSKADLGIYNSSDETIKLSGNVVIISKESILKGSRGITNLKTGLSNLIGNVKKGQRVKGVFLPKKTKKNGD